MRRLERRRILVMTTLEGPLVTSNLEEAGIHVQNTYRENTHQGDLLHFRQLQLDKQWHWHQKECHISYDIHRCIEEPYSLEAKAATGQIVVPELGHRHAVNVASNNGPR